ncbi:MAG: diguanylate cyclase [Candidatus Desulfofervidaceae bacterium]|nr:diguanylate cyclase [Candidatus Desulfofervidaceae bacterium]
MVETKGIFLLVFPQEQDFFKKTLGKTGYKLYFYTEGKHFLEELCAQPPAAVILDLDASFSVPPIQIIQTFKTSNVFLEVPIIAICTLDVLQKIELNKMLIDDFILRPLREVELIKRFELVKLRASYTLDANPLTKLPGNTTIISKIQLLIEQNKDFALGYVDLNHFKAYNDKYGFSRGDEVIKMLARVLTNVVYSLPEEGFVGHIGGDDFVFIVPPEEAENIAKQIIAYFDEIVPSFYDSEDRKRGKIISKNRQGKIGEFPIMTVAIAIVRNWKGYRLEHYGQAIKIVTELKKIAKADRSKSTYVIERRSLPE